MITEGYFFSINFLKENFLEICKIMLIPFLLVLLFFSIDTNSKQISIDNDPTKSLLFIFSDPAFLFYLLYDLWVSIIVIMFIDDRKSKKQRNIVNYYFQSLFFIIPILIAGLFSLFLIICGLFMFILPGIYIGIRMIFVPYLIVVRRTSIIDSFKFSFTLSESKVSDILYFIIPFFIFALFYVQTSSSINIMINLVINYFLITPLIYSYMYFLYIRYSSEYENL
tara:strand:+ start:5122 stop:5793 length:672 start_codon:yes stop_codon:yes gene_type:complete